MTRPPPLAWVIGLCGLASIGMALGIREPYQVNPVTLLECRLVRHLSTSP